MKKRLIGSVAAMSLLLVSTVVPASGDGGSRKKKLEAHLSGYQEVPSLSTTGRGHFRLQVNRHEDGFTYRLKYSGVEGDVLQSHLHLGQRATNGGVMVFLCTNLGNGPAGVQPCPPSPGQIEGFINADNVVGPNAQGIAAGELEEVLRAIRSGAAYVNVHSNLYPGGEIRGQIR